MKSIAVYCGSSAGHDERYAQHAADLGRALVARGLTLVYGGGRVGLMGAVADAVLTAGGRAVGVIPQFLLDKEVGHRGLTQLHVVDTMHQRKLLMADLADGFVALPGGFGTLEELFEVLTWGQLGLHAKPVGVLNTGGFYDGLLSCLDQMVGQGFLRAENRNQLLQATSVENLLDQVRDFRPRPVAKWLTSART